MRFREGYQKTFEKRCQNSLEKIWYLQTRAFFACLRMEKKLFSWLCATEF